MAIFQTTQRVEHGLHDTPLVPKPNNSFCDTLKSVMYHNVAHNGKST